MNLSITEIAEIIGLAVDEAVKEPHFLDFRLCKINNLQVKNCQFWEFFYSLDVLEQLRPLSEIKFLRKSHLKFWKF